MKKVISDFVKSLGGSTEYSGRTRTMFINDPKKGQQIESIEAAVYNKWGFEILPFDLKTN